MRGKCWMSVDGVDPFALGIGDCYVLVRGSAYALRDELGSTTRSCFDVIGERIGTAIEIGGGKQRRS